MNIEHKIEEYPNTSLDIGGIVKLYGGKTDKICKILKMYIENLPTQFQNLQNNLVDGQASLLQASIHSIKNSFSYLGHDELKDLAKQVEGELSFGEIDDNIKLDVQKILNSKGGVMRDLNILKEYCEKS